MGEENRVRRSSVPPPTKAGGITFDVSRPPVRRITVVGAVSEAAVREYLAEAKRHLDQGRPHVLVYDLLRMNALDAVHRRIQAEWVAENRAAIGELCRGAGFAMHSAMQRGALTAVLWLTPLPFAHAIFRTVMEAEHWALQQIGPGTSPPGRHTTKAPNRLL